MFMVYILYFGNRRAYSLVPGNYVCITSSPPNYLNLTECNIMGWLPSSIVNDKIETDWHAVSLMLILAGRLQFSIRLAIVTVWPNRQ